MYTCTSTLRMSRQDTPRGFSEYVSLSLSLSLFHLNSKQENNERCLRSSKDVYYSNGNLILYRIILFTCVTACHQRKTRALLILPTAHHTSLHVSWTPIYSRESLTWPTHERSPLMPMPSEFKLMHTASLPTVPSPLEKWDICRMTRHLFFA